MTFETAPFTVTAEQVRGLGEVLGDDGDIAPTLANVALTPAGYGMINHFPPQSAVIHTAEKSVYRRPLQLGDVVTPYLEVTSIRERTVPGSEATMTTVETVGTLTLPGESEPIITVTSALTVAPIDAISLGDKAE